MGDLYQDLFKHAACGIVVLDLTGRVLDYNPAALRLLGRERSNIFERPLGDFFGPGFAATFHERLKHLQQLGHLTFEARGGAAGQDDLLLDATLVPWGGHEAVLVFLREVSRREQLDLELAWQRQAMRAVFDGKYRRLFFAGQDGVVTRFPLEDPAKSGQYAAVPGTEEAASAASAERDAGRLRELLSSPAGAEALARAWRGEAVRLPPRWHAGPGGAADKPRWLQLELAPLRGRGGAIASVLLALTEETGERGAAEEDLRAVRGTELAVFSGALLSELSNYLGVMLAQASTLRLSAPPGGLAPPAVGAILDAGRQAAGVLRRCSEAALAAGEAWGSAGLNQAVLDAAGILNRMNWERILVRLDLAESLPLLRGDEALLREAVVALGRVARAAMPAGGELRLRTHLVESVNPAAPPGVGLDISDTGVGLDSMVRAQILDSLLPPGNVPGDPLELAFARAVIRQHRGQLEIDSAPGRGTTWRIVFPGREARPKLTGPQPSSERLPEEEVLQDQLANAALAGVTLPPVSSARLPVQDLRPAARPRVMLADDEENFREFGRAVLSGLGCEPAVASDGQEAFEHFQEEPHTYSLVILDAYMPRLGGLETYLRMQVLKPDLPVLFVSGFVRGPSRDALLAACPGRARVILKPFSADDLAGAVRLLLGLRTSGLRIP